MMSSKKPKGTNDGIKGVEKWFSQFQDFKYDTSLHVLDNFEQLIKHRGISYWTKTYRKYLNSLIRLIPRCTSPYPANSGCSEYARSYFQAFPEFDFNPAETALANVERLGVGPKTPGEGVGQRILDLREHFEKAMKADNERRNAHLKMPQSAAEVASRRPAPTVSKTLSRTIDIREVEQLVQHVAPKFFSKYGAYRYNHADSVAKNFVRLARSHLGDDTLRYQVRLHCFIEKAVNAMQPGPMDTVFVKDYAAKFWAKHGDFKRLPGTTSREAFRQLAAYRNWSMSKQEHKTTQRSLESRLIAAIASDIVSRLSESSSLSALTAKNHAAVPSVAVKQHPAKNKPNIAAQKATVPETQSPDANVQRFMDRFPHFVPDPSETVSVEFERLAIQQNWSKGSPKYIRQRADYLRDQLEEEWSDIIYTPDESDDEIDETGNFGVDISRATKLAQWQNLCNELGIDPVPKTMTQCRKALQKVYVNIIDLLDARRVNNGEGEGTVTVRRFESASALAKYTHDSQKIFPKAQAKRQGALKALLVHVFGHAGSKVRGV